MTSPHAHGGPPSTSPNGGRANWFDRRARVLSDADRRMYRELVRALASVEATLANLDGDERITARTNRMQLNKIRSELARLIRELFSDVLHPIISAARLNAVEAAATARLADDAEILQVLFPNAKDLTSFQRSQVAKARRNIDAMMTRVSGRSQRPLSRQVYYTGALSRGWVDGIINSGLARGASAREVADQVKSSIKPNVPGGVSYAAMRLARTEINNAFHAQTIADAVANPWVADCDWHLSKIHRPDPGDLCELYAQIKTYPKEAIPDKPHPQCRCYLVPSVVDWGEFEMNLNAGNYDHIRLSS